MACTPLSAGDRLGKWTLDAKIGHGAFSDVFSGTRSGSAGSYALKVSKLPPKSKAKSSKKKQMDGSLQLCWESTLYHNFLSQGSHPGIPKVPWGYGEAPGYRFLAMEKLGPSLESIWEDCQDGAPFVTVAKVAAQMVDVLRHVHSKGLLHRDVKPANFMVGTGANSGRVFLVDFGTAEKYKEYSGKHKEWSESAALVGTPSFMSEQVFAGCAAGRRDDLESVGYIACLLCRGSLPWSVCKSEKELRKVRENSSKEDVCEGLPAPFLHLFESTQDCAFDASPDYDGIIADLLAFAGVASLKSKDLTALDWKSGKSTAKKRAGAAKKAPAKRKAATKAAPKEKAKAAAPTRKRKAAAAEAAASSSEEEEPAVAPARATRGSRRSTRSAVVAASEVMVEDDKEEEDEDEIVAPAPKRRVPAKRAAPAKRAPAAKRTPAKRAATTTKVATAKVAAAKAVVVAAGRASRRLRSKVPEPVVDLTEQDEEEEEEEGLQPMADDSEGGDNDRPLSPSPAKAASRKAKSPAKSKSPKSPAKAAIAPPAAVDNASFEASSSEDEEPQNNGMFNWVAALSFGVVGAAVGAMSSQQQ